MNLSDDIFFNEFTAQEAILNAYGVSSNITPDPGQPGFETAVIARCIQKLQILPDQIPEISSEIIRVIRTRFVHHTTTQEIPVIAKDVVTILLKNAGNSELETRDFVMLAVQLTTAILSLMKTHEWYEKYNFTLDELSESGIDTDALRRYISVFEPAKSEEIIKHRLQEAGFSQALWPFANASRNPDALIHGCGQVPDEEFVQGFSDKNMAEVLNQDINALPQYVSAILKAPVNWLYEQYQKMTPQAKHAVWVIISKKRAIQNKPLIDEMHFESWLSEESANADNARQWLLNQPALATGGSVSRVFSALRRRETEDPDWYSKWLREVDVDFPPTEHIFWENSDRDWRCFESFWLAEAWREAGNAFHAIKILQDALANGLQMPQLWLLHADILIDMQHLGEAENAISQAKTSAEQYFPDDNRIQTSIRQTSAKLARSALQTALSAQEITPSLLELAMQFGDSETVSEAALCAFDADCLAPDILPEILANAPDARSTFIEKLAQRRDLDHLDNTYDLCSHLEKLLPNAPELRLLEAICQIDNPCVATQTLSAALRHIPDTEQLHWTAVELWIELQTQQLAFDEAIYGIVHSLGSPHPRAVRALMLLIAYLPREARPMLQTMMMENLGADTARKAFERAKDGYKPAAAKTEEIISVEELANTLMPLSWQMIYRAARTPKPESAEESAKRARREAVLAARGLSQRKPENAPEPAEWVHASQPKASDAFNP